MALSSSKTALVIWTPWISSRVLASILMTSELSSVVRSGIVKKHEDDPTSGSV